MAGTSPPPCRRRFAADLEGVADEHREKLETLNGVHSNAAGLRRWLAGRGPADATGAEPGT